MLLEAWNIVEKRCPEWYFHIYGSHDGDMGNFEKLKQTINNYKLSNVFFFFVTNDVFSKYVESDFYVMSSRFESLWLSRQKVSRYRHRRSCRHQQ